VTVQWRNISSVFASTARPVIQPAINQNFRRRRTSNAFDFFHYCKDGVLPNCVGAHRIYYRETFKDLYSTERSEIVKEK
jgi:hypothetical protein